MFRPFLIALQFLTCIPVRLRRAPGLEEVGRSLLWYPLVGLLLGAGLAAAALAVQAGHLPVLPAAALATLLWCLLTGGLHLDGLADTADAWIGGRGDPQRTLAIMKDPHCGPMAVIALVCVLLLKFSSLVAILGSAAPLAVMWPPVLGRGALLLLFLTTRYVRPGGLGEALARHFPRSATVGSLLLVAIVVAAVGQWAGAAGLAGALLAFLVVRSRMVALLGGTTGDTAGALVELVEAAALVAIAWQTALDS